MCLALTGKVLDVRGKKATVDMYGKRRKVNAEFLKPSVGDKVMVFNDFIIEVIED
ncbi:MAG: HypC/HybG/HupF family hydrogenase formation chaperone [Candidatus Aenigmarchaeota archaeon]|nr:HypC/HybG/HupF family hydrogenase formation chaperone [Candidatus Aenigmarchaeota archaeon]